MEIPIFTYKAKDNTEKLPVILEEMKIKDEKLTVQITEEIKHNKNCNQIIDILEYMVDMFGVKKNFENMYTLYHINRDLVQLDSPVWSDPMDYVYDISKFPTKTEKLDINDIIHEYLEAEYMKGNEYNYSFLTPKKKTVEKVLKYLMRNCNIYSFNIGDIYDCPAEQCKEYDDLLPYDHEIEVMRIL